MTPGELALNLHLEEPGKDYQPQKKQKKAKKWLGNEILFVSLCRCGEKRFLFTRRKRRWGEGVMEQRLLNGTCPGTSGWKLEAGRAGKRLPTAKERKEVVR